MASAAQHVVQQQHRELSGAFCDADKWQDCWQQLCASFCSITSLRIYHNTPAQLQGTAEALRHNSSVCKLDVGVVVEEEQPAGAAADALAALLKDTSSLHTFSIQELHTCAGSSSNTGNSSSAASSAAPAATAAAEFNTSVTTAAAEEESTAQTGTQHQQSVPLSPVFQGLCANRSITRLTLHKLQPAQILQLAAALSAATPGGDACGGRLQQLHLPGARFDAAAAAALSHALVSKQHHLTHLGLKGAAFAACSCSCTCLCSCSCNSKQQQQQQQQQQQSDSQDSNSAASCSSSSPDVSPPATQCAVSCLFSAALAEHPCLQEVSLQAATRYSTSSSPSRPEGGSSAKGGLCCVGLGVFVARSKQLQQLVLAEACLGDEGAQQLGSSMCRCAAATAAAAGAAGSENNNISSDSSSSIQLSWLTVLDLSNNGSIGTRGAQLLGQGLGAACPALKTLKLGGNSLGAEGVRAFVEGLAAVEAGNPTGAQPAGSLCELVVSENAITDASGVLALLTHPTIGQTLTHLNLSNNCLDDSAAKQLAAALGNTATVTSSSSSSSNTSSAASSLRVLDLSHNWIKDEGASAFAALLQHPSSCTLSTLLLHHNRMSRAGVEAFADAAISNRRVQEVQLQGNRALGRLQVLEDLKLVLADRRHKQQQQQQNKKNEAEQHQQQTQQQQRQGQPKMEIEQEQQGQKEAGNSSVNPPGSSTSSTSIPSSSNAPSQLQSLRPEAASGSSQHPSPFASVAAATTAAAAAGGAGDADAHTPVGNSGSEGAHVHDAAAHISLTTGLGNADSKAAAAAADTTAVLSSDRTAGHDTRLQLQLVPSLAGRLLQRRHQQRLLQQVGVCERSFSFDQWCEEELAGPASVASSAATGDSPHRSHAGVSATSSNSGSYTYCVGDPVQQQQHPSDDSMFFDAFLSGGGGAAEGDALAFDVFGAGTVKLGGRLKQSLGGGGGSRVTSLSGWMSDAAFSAAGQELSLPGVSRRYVFVHGRGSSGSSNGGGGSSSCGQDSPVTLKPFYSSSGGGSVSGSLVGGLGGVTALLQTASSSGSGSGGGKHARLLMRSVDGGSGGPRKLLRLQPARAAACLQLAEARSSSSSSSEDGGGVGGTSDGGCGSITYGSVRPSRLGVVSSRDV